MHCCSPSPDSNFPPRLAIATAISLLVLAPVSSAFAYTLKTLHSFCTETNCGDGETPRSGLLMDKSGNLYGTTEFGGKYNKGLVFKLIPNQNKTKYTEHILKNFCARPECADGAYPDSELIMDVDGNLYGATQGGGTHTDGAIFKMKPLQNGWSFGVIHSFCAHPPACADGGVPYGGLAYAGQFSGKRWDETSPLFGTTSTGGANDKGTTYELSPSGSGWSHHVLHSFNPSGGVESAYPGPLVVDASGNLLGVTYYGGKYGAGMLYRLASGTWNEVTLHNFCAEAICADGARGVGRLAMDVSGNLFGTTMAGGSGSNCGEPGLCGVAFERTESGKYKVIYDFCAKTKCKDGAEPAAGPIVDSSGNLFGVTGTGGAANGGTAFMLSRNAGQWTEQVLYSFCSENGCADGGHPAAPVIEDGGGNIYGTTYDGGANGDAGIGTVFGLQP